MSQIHALQERMRENITCNLDGIFFGKKYDPVEAKKVACKAKTGIKTATAGNPGPAEGTACAGKLG
jgi:hypothetical protein